MKLVHGFGINDADYKTQGYIGIKRWRCKAYSAWCNMISRCYSDKEVKRNPTYRGVTVCDEWRSFMCFRGWWLANHVDGWHLDKDILSDLMVYSPSTCLFVPQWLNKFITSGGANSGVIGASIHASSGKVRARCSDPMTGRVIFLGLYDNEESAHEAWIDKKLTMALECKNVMDGIDKRIHARVVEIISRM